MRMRAYLLLLLGAMSGCATKDSGPRTYDEFLTELPDAICEYYVRCALIDASQRTVCGIELREDVADALGCNAARGVYLSLAEDLGACLDDNSRACTGDDDDLGLFCPNLEYLADQCSN
ncbi:MAG: hypothetical protein ACKV2T_44000 [Kofleriaceae bacterium]